MTRSDHLLTILAEESVEVAQRATKALRFGISEVQPSQTLDNAERIVEEYADLVATIEMLEAAGLLRMGETFRDQVEAKKIKVERYLAYSRAQGRLDDAQPPCESDNILPNATEFTFGDTEHSGPVFVCARGNDRWAVMWRAWVLNRDGKWEYEPSPSSRDDAFIARTRWTLNEALDRARAQASLLQINCEHPSDIHTPEGSFGPAGPPRICTRYATECRCMCIVCRKTSSCRRPTPYGHLHPQ